MASELLTLLNPVEARYQAEIIENIGDPRGREIEYDDRSEPPMVRFL
jgi:hypothetical protein